MSPIVDAQKWTERDVEVVKRWERKVLRSIFGPVWEEGGDSGPTEDFSAGRTLWWRYARLTQVTSGNYTGK